MADSRQETLDKLAAEREKMAKDFNARIFFATNSIVSKWMIDHEEEVIGLAGSTNTSDWTQSQWESIFKRVEESDEYNEYLNADQFFNSNLRASENFLLHYLASESRDEIYSETIKATVLYFFATSDVEPWSYNGLTDDNKNELKDIFSRIDNFYVANGNMAIRAKDLVKAFADAELKSNSQGDYIDTSKHYNQEKVDRIVFPLDKVNSTVWNFGDIITGEIYIKAEKTNSERKQQINIIYSISFDELGDDIKIERYINQYDKRIYETIGALWDAGNEVFSLTQIYKSMGYDDIAKPDTNAISRIRESVLKMMHASININNEQEVAAKYKYDKVVYHGSLLPCEFVDGIMRGQVVETAIHLFREPPLLTFAKKRKQVTTIAKRLLQSPISKTEGNLCIEDYLLRRLTKARHNNKKSLEKILLSTFFKEMNLTEAKKRQRALDSARKCLDHYKKEDFISGYTIDDTCIIVFLEKKTPISK